VLHRIQTVLGCSLLAVVLGLVSLVVAPPASAHEGNYPIVLLHGWTGSSDSWSPMIPKLQAQGLTVLDFDPGRAGVQALSYQPSGPGQHISYLAGKVVEVDIVSHSMGGLVARFLIEQPGADVENWSSATGWFGDGLADVAAGWASRVDDLVMLGTPNHGTWQGWVPSTLGLFADWSVSGGDMAPASRFLSRLGYRMPAGEDYSAIGGDPTVGQYLRYDYDGDGVRHGFDLVVPAESPYVTGAGLDIVNATHSDLRTADAPLDLTIGALGYTSNQTGDGSSPLRGTLKLRLEYAEIVADHDWGSDDENNFEFWVDTNGGSNSYTKLSTIAYERDAPFANNWGNGGPLTAGITLPGTSSVIDVKIVVYELDTRGSRDAVSTVYLRNLGLSEDLDGLDYYQATAAEALGGTNTFRISLNGVTSQVT
jgi:pimeloyl-ACP methyl ester carboxylesterase